jgi:hypothetical protein
MKRLASRSNRLFMSVLVLMLSWGAAPAWACGGPSALPTAATVDLDDDVAQWGVWCGGAPTTALSASAQSLLVDYQHSGGDSSEFAHVYRNLLPDLSANTFKLNLEFNYQPGGGSATADAVQFSMSAWRNQTRYEWAVEWLNLGTTNTWRFWDGTKFVDLGVSRDLSPGVWHKVELVGTITSTGKVRYTSFKVDGHTSQIRLETIPVPYPGWPDQLAVATTIVGTGGEAFSMYLDKVDFSRSTVANPSVDNGAAQAKATKTPKK